MKKSTFHLVLGNSEYKFVFSYPEYNAERRNTECRVFVDHKPVLVEIDIPLKIPVMGIAFCNPKDTFVKSTGRKLSLMRCMQMLGLSEDQMSQVWTAYYRAFANRKNSNVSC